MLACKDSFNAAIPLFLVDACLCNAAYFNKYPWIQDIKDRKTAQIGRRPFFGPFFWLPEEETTTL